MNKANHQLQVLSINYQQLSNQLVVIQMIVMYWLMMVNYDGLLVDYDDG